MPDPVSSILNLGPATEAAFARAGIHSADEIRAMGADAAYLRLMEAGTPPHFIGYYVLVMGLQGRPWNDCQGAEKRALRVRFDALKARALADFGAEAHATRSLDAALAAIGVIPAPKG
ncbi:TfoX/Sxy family DNA transformation protein [Tabrizicola sp.]|uniref:TfoX/Sxy family DNA transformation protein n=1 Tax=Tabrizicola sp. TaxID=2005166 RepID=UPI003D2924B2